MTDYKLSVLIKYYLLSIIHKQLLLSTDCGVFKAHLKKSHLCEVSGAAKSYTWPCNKNNPSRRCMSSYTETNIPTVTDGDGQSYAMERFAPLKNME